VFAGDIISDITSITEIDTNDNACYGFFLKKYSDFGGGKKII
jgi:hypothetical protein